MFFHLESFVLVLNVYRSLFFAIKHISKYGENGGKFFFFKESALLMLFRTFCKSLSVRSHRIFIVHFMTITMVAAIFKKNFTVIAIFSM